MRVTVEQRQRRPDEHADAIADCDGILRYTDVDRRQPAGVERNQTTTGVTRKTYLPAGQHQLLRDVTAGVGLLDVAAGLPAHHDATGHRLDRPVVVDDQVPRFVDRQGGDVGGRPPFAA